ncbi:ABC transporter permease [Cumulibacter soli]|uniref:ABC transporter permease n=1 Tax=Cumulibacter soli TaxID=2546344 RepID=UPI0010689898|nr:ABC transporter permease [Cumulibacter soli]
MAQLLTLVIADLRQRIRDKSVLIFAIGVPLGLMIALNFVIGGAMNQELQKATVAISVPENDQLGQALEEMLPQLGIDIEVTAADAEEVHELAESGDAKLGIIVPDGFTDAAIAAEPSQLDVIEGDGAGLESDVVLSAVQGYLDRVGAAANAAQAAGELGIQPDAIVQEVLSSQSAVSLTEGQASSEQLDPSGALVAGQAGLFLMFTVSFGVLALMEERQNGTLARLYSMPMPRMFPVLAKAISSFVLGVVATSVLLITGGLLFDVDFGSALVVAVLIVCAVLATTALTFIVARLAKTAEQANIIQTMLAMVLGIAGGAFVQFSASGVIGAILDLNPVAALVRGLGISSGGGGLSDVGAPVAIMLGFAVVAALIARLVPDRGARG